MLRDFDCEMNVEDMLTAMRMYLDANDNTFPLADAWCDALEPYLDAANRPAITAFVCPRASHLPCGYAFNAALSGLSYEALTDPEHTVVIFESDAGRNAHGGPELLPERPRHWVPARSWKLTRPTRDVYGFVDLKREFVAIVRFVRRGTEAEQVQWNPRRPAPAEDRG